MTGGDGEPSSAAPSAWAGHRPGWIAALGVVVLACVALGVAPRAQFLSDDLLIPTLLDAETGSVAWGRVLADFGRGWFGLEGPLYRPLLTLSYAVDLTLWGVSPRGFHLTNTLLHAVACGASVWVVYAVARARGVEARVAALSAGAAGVVLAVHPVAVECVDWIAARNSGLEVCFRSVALAAFATAGLGAARGCGVAALVFGACALASKESAVLLLPGALVIHALQRTDAPFAVRPAWRRLGPWLALVGAYFALRLALFGVLIGSPGDVAVESGKWAIAGDKVLAVLWPDAASAPLGSVGVAACTAMCVGLLGAAVAGGRAGLLALGLGVLWLAASLAPTHSLPLHPDLSGSRLVLGATHAWFVTAGIIAALANARMRWVLTLALVCGGLAFSLGPTWARKAAFREAWADAATARAGLEELGAGLGTAPTGVPAPLGVINLATWPGTPPMNPNGLFPLAQPATRAATIPFVGVGWITIPVPGSESLLGDPSAARALWADGGTVAFWDPVARSLQAIRSPQSPSPSVALRAGPSEGAFEFAQPVHPLTVDAVHVEAPSDGLPPPALTLHLEPAAAALPSNALFRIPLAVQPAEPGTVRYTADLTHAMGPFGWSCADPNARLTGFTIHAAAPDSQLRDAKLPTGLTVRATQNTPTIAWPAPLAGTALDLETALPTILSRLPIPTDSTRHATHRLLFLCAHSTLEVPVTLTDGQWTAQWPKPALINLRLLRDIDRRREIWFVLERRADTTARTPLDSFRLRTSNSV